MFFNDGVVIKPSKFGKGLFANKNFEKGEIICLATGKFLTFKETLLLGESESHSLQIEKDKYILCEPPFLYSNHSCHPNSALTKDLQFYALKNIDEGEEFFWDYSTSMLERHWTMKCNCGNRDCRKIITDFDLLLKDIQNKYLQWNIVLPFIVCELNNKGLIEHRA